MSGVWLDEAGEITEQQWDSLDKRKPDEWLRTPELKGIIILDPDGWRTEGSDWEKPITKEEFNHRLMQCTLGGVLPV